MKKIIIFLLILTSSTMLFGQSKTSLGLLITPELYLPVGNRAEKYTLGFGGTMDSLLGIPSLPYLTPSLNTCFSLIPLDIGEKGLTSTTNLSLIRAGIGLNLSHEAGQRLLLSSRAHLSLYYAALTGENSGTAGSFAWGLSGGLGFLFSPTTQVGVSAGYNAYRDLYSGLSLSLGTTIRLSGPGNSAIPRKDFILPGGHTGLQDGYIRFTSLELDPVFPVLYKYYDSHPIGTIRVVNTSSRSVENIEIRMSMKQYMDAPKLSARINTLQAWEEREVDIYALFTEDILTITEGAKVAAEVYAEYDVAGRNGRDGEIITLEAYSRNALRWDDDRKIAAFVTARDDEVQRFARVHASIVQDRGINALCRELQLAMVFLEAMNAAHCAYAVDPSSAYLELSRNKQAIDMVQFPRQTLQFRAGDCDDLSSTFAALLESSGIPTAFITVPGHIFTAFQLDMTADEARRSFFKPEDLILRKDGSVWVPVETTLLRDGFLLAWDEGASRWRKHAAEGDASFLITREAWRTYEPVAFRISNYEVDIPLRDEVLKAFGSELDRFIFREIGDREQNLLADLRQQPGDPRLLNSLGVLYARYGKYEQAKKQFHSAAVSGRYIPALINLGNILCIKGDHAEARKVYQQALVLGGDNAAALVGLVRVACALEDYEESKHVYTRLKDKNPEIAEQFRYLAGGSATSDRAVDPSLIQSDIVWEEE